MQRLSKLIFLIFLIIGCSSNREIVDDGYVLKGKTKGISDGEVIQLYDTLSEIVIDSTVVESNLFELKGNLSNPPSSIIIRTKDYENYKFVWMENKHMTFDASKSDFQNAVLTGSELQEWAQVNLYDKTDTIEIKDKDDIFRIREIEMQFVEEFPNNIISANILSVYAACDQFSLERIKNSYYNLSDKSKQHQYGQKIYKTIKTLESIDTTKTNPQIGDSFIDFEMADSEGNKVRLSESLGKVTLLEFWASWCGPCISEMPNLKQTSAKYNALGLEVIAVSLDRSEVNWKSALEELDLDWINVSDLNGNSNFAAMQYGVDGIPDNFLINSEGKIVGRKLRGEDLELQLDKLFN